MNKKIICIAIIGMFLLTGINAVGMNVNSSNSNGQEVTTFEDRHVTVYLHTILMWDYIDGFPISDKYADFRIKVWVYDGIDDDGDNYWECNLPDNIHYLEDINQNHRWSIGDKNAVDIRVEVWDRDLLWDEYCDINGASIDETAIDFGYNVVSNSYSLSGTGGQYSYGYRVNFDGTWDGTNGQTYPDDDNDVFLSLKVRDDYKIPPELELDDVNTDFGTVNIDESKERRVCSIKNIGEVTATVNVYLRNGDLDEFRITANGGQYNIRPDFGAGIYVEFMPKYAGSKTIELVIDGEDPCNDFTLTLTATGKKSVSRNLSFFQFLSRFPVLEKLLELLKGATNKELTIDAGDIVVNSQASPKSVECNTQKNFDLEVDDESCKDGSLKLIATGNHVPERPNVRSKYIAKRGSYHKLGLYAKDVDNDEVYFFVNGGSSLMGSEARIRYGPFSSNEWHEVYYTFEHRGFHLVQVTASNERDGVPGSYNMPFYIYVFRGIFPILPLPADGDTL